MAYFREPKGQNDTKTVYYSYIYGTNKATKTLAYFAAIWYNIGT